MLASLAADASGRERKDERASFTYLAFDPDLAAVQLDEPLGEPESEPGCVALLEPSSVCWNGSQIRSTSSAAMPTPVSCTVIQSWSLCRSRRRAHLDVAAGRL